MRAVLTSDVLSRAVLIVEDESMIAWMLEDLLRDMGFEHVAIAATGADAIVQAERVAPGLIVSDINLGPDGIDGIAAAAAIVRRRVAPVLFVSAYAGPAARERIARDIPHAIMLRKPIVEEELVAALGALAGTPS